MIQDIAPHVYDNAFAHRREARPDDCVFLPRGEKEMLVVETENGFRFPKVYEVGDDGLYFAFLIDEVAFYVKYTLPEDITTIVGATFADQTRFRSLKPQHLAFAGITGMQLIRWLNAVHFCGACGTELEPSSWERAFVCPQCGRIVYPRLNPAVIIGVTHGDKILTTAYADRPSRGLALIAGFTELGETLEETVHREVMEEVGLKVKNLRYYKSQPWSFTDTLLMGFFCELDGEDETVHLDEQELKEGRWISREDLPDRTGEAALTAEMMQMFKEGRA